MTVELATGEHEVEKKEPGPRCDQCHADSGIKKKSKKTFSKAESHDAKFVVTLNGARMLLCEDHKNKLDRSLSKVKFDYDFKAKEIE